MNVNELLKYINEHHECKHLFWMKRRGQDIDDLFKLQRKYDNTNLYFNIINPPIKIILLYIFLYKSLFSISIAPFPSIDIINLHISFLFTELIFKIIFTYF